MEKHKIAIIGNKEITLGFKALGVEIFDATNPEQALEILTELKKEKIKTEKEEKPKYAIIFITEDLAKNIPEEDYKKIDNEALPAIIPVPSSKKAKDNYGIHRISKMVEQAVGSDIFGE